MKFNYKECTAQDVANIKKLYKQQSNNPKITKKYTDILEDTKTAIKNLNSCITSQEKLRTIMKLIQQENTSFMKNIIGVNERGNNNSYYRGFLSLDEKNVLEIRIANHYETENSAKDKSNNVSQFLFQVVLKTTPPKNQTTDSITKNKKVANLNIITKTLKTNSTIEEVCSLLKCISDFLISPSDDYANNEQTTIKDTNSINNKQINCNINMKTNKKTIRLTESDLKNIIKESVERILNEGKVVNNKGIFNDYWDGWRKEKPGFCVNRDINNFKKPPIGADNEYLKYFDNKEDFENAIKKHNERTDKYTGGYLTRKASEDNYRWKQNSRRNLARHFKNMLHFNNISSHTYYKSSPEKRNYYWDKYFRDYNREYNAIENERQETAYWNNLMDMADGSNGW